MSKETDRRTMLGLFKVYRGISLKNIDGVKTNTEIGVYATPTGIYLLLPHTQDTG